MVKSVGLQGVNLPVKELDSLLQLLTDKKRKAEQEEAEANMEILLDFLLRSRQQKQEVLHKVRCLLKPGYILGAFGSHLGTIWEHRICSDFVLFHVPATRRPSFSERRHRSCSETVPRSFKGKGEVPAGE